jgi:phosphatidylserine synthase
MFSTAHLLDWLNIHLLISPFGLPLIIMTLVAVYRFRLALFERQSDRDYAYFLGLTAALYLLLTWLWNPDYGGRKDWDLFAPAAFVYTLLASYLLVHTLTRPEKLRAAGLFVIAVCMLHTGAWIFANTHPLPR